jgi:Uma2 family endonuclease
LISPRDDGIVVVMTTKEYLHTYETNQPRELAHGMVCEPPAPFFSHQQVALKIARLLADPVEAARGTGNTGVREYWLVEPADGRVTVINFDGPAPEIQIARRPDDAVRSTVVEGFSRSASALLP